MAEPLLAKIFRRGGSRLLDAAAGRVFSAKADAPRPKRSISGAIAGAAITRLATRSVPGAILVGGGFLAKKLYDRKRARRNQADEPFDAND